MQASSEKDNQFTKIGQSGYKKRDQRVFTAIKPRMKVKNLGQKKGDPLHPEDC